MCDVTSELFSAESDPYDAVVPYSTCVVAAWLVVHVMVAEVDVMALTVTEVIVGAAAGAVPEVVKVKFADVAKAPAAFLDHTA